MSMTPIALEEIAAFEAAVTRHADSVETEMELEHTRPVRKHEAILRIMESQVQPSGKPHSYSSAEAIVETDAEYAAFLTRQRDVARAARLASGQREAARLRAELVIALVRHVTVPETV